MDGGWGTVLFVVPMMLYGWYRSGVVALQGSIAGNVFAYSEPLRMLKLVRSSQISLPDSSAVAVAVHTGPLHGVAAALEAVQGHVTFTPADSTGKAGSVVNFGAVHCDELCSFQ